VADRYVRSTDGSDADDGTTWALAKSTLTGMAVIDTAGDRIFVSQVHAESTGALVSLAWAGTLAAPTRIICGDDAAQPPTAVATTATVTTTGANAINVFGAGYGYCYGITFLCGTGATTADLSLSTGAGIQSFEQCSFQLVHTAAAGRINTTNVNNTTVIVKECTVKFANTAQSLNSPNRSETRWFGGSILAGSSAITLFFIPAASCVASFTGFDLSNAAAAVNLTNSTSANVKFTMRDCKLPASWSGSLNASAPGLGSVYEMHNCDSGDTNYRYIRQTQLGTITSETVIVRTDGEDAGDPKISWKMVSNTNTEFPHETLESAEIVRWNETVGSAITATVEIVHDSQGSGSGSNFTDAEAWLEVLYLGTSGFPLGSFITDRAANILSTPVNQASSTVAWTTTGLTTPVKQKLSVTFTPQEKGYIHAIVHLAGASDTCYVEPWLTIT
jgi:hypothetical protein